jgi:hypothetical protein
MRGISYIFLFLIAGLLNQAHAQFVRMEGRKFMLNDQEFYPIVLNYGVQLTANTDTPQQVNELYLTPNGGYDRLTQSEFECTDEATADQQLLEHFQLTRAMGFNAIRVGVNAVNRRGVDGTRYYTLSVRPNLAWHADYSIYLDYPDLQSPWSMRYFDLVGHLLDLADSADLKVILLTGGRVGYEPYNPNDIWQPYNATDAAAYATFLQRLGEELAYHPALMAYDLWNEPIWGDDNTEDLPKSTTCTWTSMWYDALRAHDSVHLVTLGGANRHELSSWDPAMMKLDFYSPHIYPLSIYFDGYSAAAAFERVDDEICWTGSTCPMPWLVGEISFAANDDTTDYHTDPNVISLDADPLHHQPPWMMGDEHTQRDYWVSSLDAVRRYGGSGYSWWKFQDERGDCFSTDEPLPKNPWAVNGEWMGVLSYGNGSTIRWREKLIVDTLEDYVLPPVPAQFPDVPASYYDPWQPNTAILRQGQVRSSSPDHLSVQNALISGAYQYSLPIQVNDTLTDTWWVEARVFNPTDANGNWVYRSAPLPDPDTSFGEWEHSWTAPPRVVASGQAQWVYTVPENYIQQTIMPFDLVFADQIITQPKDIKSWSTMEVANISIGQVPVDFHDRDVIHIASEFHAPSGSTVHIWNERTWPDCASDTYHRPEMTISASTPMAAPMILRAGPIRELELQFAIQEVAMEVFPSPCQGPLTVMADTPGTIDLIDGEGRIVKRILLKGTSITIPTSDLAAGQYQVVLSNTIGQVSRSIIKLP